MHFKNVLVAILVCCMLSFVGCAQTQQNVQENITAITGRFVHLFDDVGETFSVRSLEKSNQTILEPEYINWQTARHYYDALSDKEKLAYRCIYNDIFGQPERISVPMLKTEELNAVFTALRYDNPQLLFLGDDATLLTAGMYCYFVPVYTLSYWDARAMIEAVAAKSEEVVLSLSQNADDYETLLTLHDYLCEMCTYADGNSASQCHGALLDGYATCAGYTKALKLMLDMAGLDSCVVTGRVSDGTTDINHMWLAVCLNGVWSFCDPTWDDPVSEDGSQTVEHGYFSVSAQRLSLTHSDIQMPSHIVCDSEEFDYYLFENLFCTQENYLTVIADGIAVALQNEKIFAEFRFDSDDALQDAAKILFDEGEVYSLLEDVSFLNETLQPNRIGYAVDEERLQLKLIFSFEE